MLSLKQKLALRLTGLLIAIALVGGVSLWGFASLQNRYDRAEEQYALLRAVYTIGHHADTARIGFMREGRPDAATEQALRQAISIARSVLDPNREPALHLEADQKTALEAIARNLDEASGADRATATPRLAETLFEAARLSGEIEKQIVANRQALTGQLQTTRNYVLGLVLAVVLIAVAISLAQYLSVARPLRRLGEGVRRLSSAHFGEKIKPTGDREFVELADRFNQMAEELGQLYASLEQRIETQSRELVRSEQMAGVGYLAAGVAHEINNPLGIISGYAEEAAEMAEKLKDAPNAEAIAKSLQVIAEEAFRCKGITQQLLNLAAPGPSQRGPVDIAEVLEQIVEVLRGLKIFKEQRLRLELPPDRQPLTVHGSAGELKQVMLNLVTNALEAVDPEGGTVTVSARRDDDHIRMEVTDNGTGMSEQVLAKAFEPFYTRAKQPGGRRGTGLGLSVSLSIVEDHGGTLRAHSDGENRGSVFTVTLPAIEV